MSNTAKILVVDDIPFNRKLLEDILIAEEYEVVSAGSGPEALQSIERDKPDLVLLDVVMPDMDGYEVCRVIRNNPATGILPVIMVTAHDLRTELVRGLEAGADDFLSKPINHDELLARVRSLVRVKWLFDQVEEQKTELERWGNTLEQRVQEQLEQLQRLERLRRFLSPQVTEVLISSNDDSLFQSHRRLIATVFCDLRGFTAFTDAVEPEEAIGVLQTYHKAMGELIDDFEGTINHRAGDGIMIIFNDPMPCDQPAFRAVQMAQAMRDKSNELAVSWRRYGYDLGFGIGVSLGYATLGMVGYEGRFDYTAFGNSINLAARLCDQARNGQILISQRVHVEVEKDLDTEYIGEFTLKGFRSLVPVFEVKN